MGIYDVSIDEARAKIWMMDVYTEIGNVELVLDKIAAAQQEMPGENDSIMAAIEKTGKASQTLWKTMNNVFKESCRLLEDAIKRYGAVGSKIVSDFEDHSKKLGY